MIKESNKILSGVYLVVDPSLEENILFQKLEAVLAEKIAAVQLWDNFETRPVTKNFMQRICDTCHAYDTPVLINNRWDYLTNSDLDGVHFDEPPGNMQEIRQQIGRPFITGLTCNNDLSTVVWAARNKFHYISFCSLFPSSTANSCELVQFDTIEKARKIFPRSIFLAGGITLQNISQLNGLEHNGIAVVSGIMGAGDPATAVKQYKEQINLFK